MFSYFLPPITNTRPALSVTLEEVYEMIISEKWAQTTRSLRSLRKGEQADFKRRQLPFVTFSGIFSARHSEHIVRHSGLMCFDFDHVGDEIAVRKLQQLLVADPTLNVQLAFRSPSGDGLKVVVECFSLTDNANKLIRWHNAQYAHIAFYIEQRYNVKVDKTNDVARACFLCHDPQAYCNSQLKNNLLSHTKDSLSPTNNTNIHKYENEIKIRDNSCNLWENKKNSVRENNSAGVKSVLSVEQCFRRSLKRANQEEKKESESVLSVLSVGNKHSEGVTSVGSVNQRSLSPWRENSVREKENAEASPASKSVSSVERFSRSERANKSSPPVLGGVPEPTVLSRMAKNGGGGLLSVSSVKSVGDNHSEGVKSVQICRAPSCEARERIEEKEELKSELSVLSVGNKHSEGVTSVSSVSSVREKESSVRDKKNSVKDKEISVRDKTSVEEKTLEMALRRIELHHIDVTTHYHDWYRIGMALASHYGEAGRDYYHRISRFYPRYTPLETNQQYDRCLRYNTHRIRLGTLFYLLNI